MLFRSRTSGYRVFDLYEFRWDGRFFKDSKPGVLICFSGNRYQVLDNKIIFSERDPDEALVNCIDCSKWEIIEIKNDTLVLQECEWIRKKFVRTE